MIAFAYDESASAYTQCFVNIAHSCAIRGCHLCAMLTPRHDLVRTVPSTARLHTRCAPPTLTVAFSTPEIDQSYLAGFCSMFMKL